MGDAGAHCAHTLVSTTRDIPKAKWDNDRVGWLCIDSQGFTDIETPIDQFCTAFNICDYESQQVLSNGLLRIKRVAKMAQKAKRHKIMSEGQNDHQ